MELSRESCVPCRKGTPSLTRVEVTELLPLVPDWHLTDDGKGISRRYSFIDFVQAMSFVNRMADLAEVEGHHPDFSVHYKDVDVELSTHDVGGLSRNDFIVAAKINQISQHIANQGTGPAGAR